MDWLQCIETLEPSRILGDMGCKFIPPNHFSKSGYIVDNSDFGIVHWSQPESLGTWDASLYLHVSLAKIVIWLITLILGLFTT
jgi:hypothetical protein